MARPLRINASGGIYHVVARGNERRAIFEGDHDRHRFLETLDAIVNVYDVRCHAYCLMTNHYHVLLETRRPNLSQAMRQLNGVYGQRFNRRHARTGHVFQGRFSATLVDRDAYLLEVCRYVVLNPVRAGLVERAGDWPWSSHGACAGQTNTPTFLCTAWILQAFDPRGGAAARESYVRFIAEGSPRPEIAAEIEDAPPALGRPEFLREWQPVATRASTDSISKSQRLLTRPDLATLFAGCTSRDERDRIVRLAHERHGFTQRQIALHLELHPTTVSLLLRGGRGRTMQRFET
jgi:putative transposase